MNPVKDFSSTNSEPAESSASRLATARRASSASTKTNPTMEKTPLPAGYEPTSYCVVCGKGKDCFNSVGNRRFRVIVDLFLERYSLSTKKSAKSEIVSSVLQTVHQAGGRFVKKEKGQWFEISEAAAREKIGAVFRDLLHFQYRSSGKAKTARRRERRTVDKEENKKRRQSSLSAQQVADLCAAPQPENRRAVSAPPSVLGGYGVGDDELVKLDLVVAAAAAAEDEPLPVTIEEAGQEEREHHFEGIGDDLFVEHDLVADPENYFQGARKKIRYDPTTKCSNIERVQPSGEDLPTKPNSPVAVYTPALGHLTDTGKNQCNSRRSSGSAPSLCEESAAHFFVQPPQAQTIHL